MMSPANLGNSNGIELITLKLDNNKGLELASRRKEGKLGREGLMVGGGSLH